MLRGQTGLPARYGPTGTLFQAFPEFIEPKTLHLQHSACTGSKAVGKGPQTPLHPQTGPRYPLAQQGAAHLHILPLPVKDSTGTTAYLVTESLQTGIEPCRTVGQKGRHRRRRLQRKGGDHIHDALVLVVSQSGDNGQRELKSVTSKR